MDFSYLDELMRDQVGTEEIEEISTGYRNIWVVAEAEQGALVPATLEAMGQARGLADQIGVYVFGLLLGSGGEHLAHELPSYGADKVLFADDPLLAEYQPEVFSKLLADLVAQYRPEILLLPATSLGNDLAPRLAQRLNTGLVSHCTKLELDMSERLLLGTCPALGGEIYHTFACATARPQMATLQPGHFHLPYRDETRSGSVQRVDASAEGIQGQLCWTSFDAAVHLPEVSLDAARIVVAAGRGMGDAQGFALIGQLAAALGGVAAGSRGAFDEGWITEGQVVGVGGHFIAPDLYVACGISGDIHHYFGIQGSKFVIAINPDEQAPIMKVANLAVVGDARQVIPAILSDLAT